MKTEAALPAAACLSRTNRGVCVQVCICVLGTGGLPKRAYIEDGEKNKNDNTCRGKEMRAKKTSIRERFSGLTKEM